MSISTSPWQDFGSKLMTDFQTQYGNQSSLLSYLTGVLQPMIAMGGQGFNAQTLAAMRTGAADTTSTQYQNAAKSLQQNQALTQEAGLPSGVAEQQKEELAASGAQANAGAQENITLANEQERENNLKFATNALFGVAHEEDPLGFAGAADSAGNTEANIENANTQQKANSFTGSFEKGLGGSLGSAVGSLATGGIGGAASVLNGGTFGQGATSALYG
jgi:hypothetical protein